nr:GIY-YIG endonuclease [Juglanconis oblonga]
MDLFKPEYNILLTAGSPLGSKQSYERVLKMSGENHYNYGKEQKEATKEAIRQAMSRPSGALPAALAATGSGDKNYFYGQTHTETTKTRLSLANPNSISLVVVDRELNKETIYNSKQGAARALGCSRMTIERHIENGSLIGDRYEVKIGERLTRKATLEVVNEAGEVKYTFLNSKECAAFFEVTNRTILRRLSKQVYFNFREGERLKVRYISDSDN